MADEKLGGALASLEVGHVVLLNQYHSERVDPPELSRVGTGNLPYL